MQPLTYISKIFNADQSSSYTLSIQCELDGLSFCVIDSNEQCLLLKEVPVDPELSPDAWETKIRDILAENEMLHGKWKQVRVLWVSRKSLIIPDKLFRKEDLKSYLILHQMLDELDEIHHIRLQNPDAWIVFPVPSAVTQIFINRFPGALFYHQAVPLLESILGKNERNQPDGFHLSLHKGFFDYAILRDGTLQTFNSFSWKDPNDILYLIIYLFRQFDLSTKQHELVLYGMTEEIDEIKKLLQKYVHHLRFAAADERLHVQSVDGLDQPAWYSNLLNLYYCES